MSRVISITTELWGNGELTVTDPVTGYYFADVEKTAGSALDAPACWLFAGCNMLFWSGWATAEGNFDTADDFYEYAISCWGIRSGGDEREAFYWWLDGGLSTGFPEYFPDGGNRFPGIPATEYGGRVTVQGAESHFALMRQFIDGGYGITLGIYAPGLAHSITCWGYEFDGESYYLYYSDSDDSKVADDRRHAEDRLKRTRITIIDNTLYLLDYNFGSNSSDAPNVRIGDFSCFIQYDPILIGNTEGFTDATAISRNAERRGRINANGDDDLFLLNINAESLALSLSFMSAEYASTATLYIYAPDLTPLYELTGDKLNLILPCADLGYVYLKVVGTAFIESDDPLANVYRLISCENGRWGEYGGLLRPLLGSTGTLYLTDTTALDHENFVGAIISGSHFKICASYATDSVDSAEICVENAEIESHIFITDIKNMSLVSMDASTPIVVRGNIDCSGGTLNISGNGENLAFNGYVTANTLVFNDFVGEFCGKIASDNIVISGASSVHLAAAVSFDLITIQLNGTPGRRPLLTAPKMELKGTAIELFISPELLDSSGYFALFPYSDTVESSLEVKLNSGESAAFFDLTVLTGFTAYGYDFTFATIDDMLFLDYSALPKATLA